MGINKTVSYEVKLQVVHDYMNSDKGMTQICLENNVNSYTVEEWVRKYKIFGEEGLILKRTMTKYSPEIKIQAIDDYINGKGSFSELSITYKIRDRSLLRRWVKEYNSSNGNKSYRTEGAIIMNNGRKTTYDERIEIVSFCLSNANDYKLTANEYNVSYQQVYSWVKKYNVSGSEGLIDRRGKDKPEANLTAADKQLAHLKQLEAEVRRLKMENDFLKKLKEIERR